MKRRTRNGDTWGQCTWCKDSYLVPLPTVCSYCYLQIPCISQLDCFQSQKNICLSLSTILALELSLKAIVRGQCTQLLLSIMQYWFQLTCPYQWTAAVHYNIPRSRKDTRRILKFQLQPISGKNCINKALDASQLVWSKHQYFSFCFDQICYYLTHSLFVWQLWILTKLFSLMNRKCNVRMGRFLQVVEHANNRSEMPFVLSLRTILIFKNVWKDRQSIFGFVWVGIKLRRFNNPPNQKLLGERDGTFGVTIEFYPKIMLDITVDRKIKLFITVLQGVYQSINCHVILCQN